MRKYVATLAVLLSMSCGNAAPKGNTLGVVEINSGPSVLVEEVQGNPVSAPKGPTLDEKIDYVISVMEEIKKTEVRLAGGPGQVKRYLPNSKDDFEVVYYPDMTCWRTPLSDQETEEEILELRYLVRDNQKKINIRLRDLYPFNSVESIKVEVDDYGSKSSDTYWFNTTGNFPLYKQLLQIFYEEFRAYEKSGKTWDSFPRGVFDGTESENQKALDLRPSFDRLYEHLEKNKDTGINLNDPNIFHKLNPVCFSP